MIEFKAECGHTVRARDEDAGKVVRCSYCGREARVPEQDDNDELAGLFADVEKSGEYTPVSDRERVKRMKRKPATPGGKPGINNQMIWIRTVLTKLITLGLIACILIFIGNKVWEQLNKNDTPNRSAAGPAGTPHNPTPQPPRTSNPRPPQRRMGLYDPKLISGASGVIVISTPEDADVYVCKEGERIDSVLGENDWVATGTTGREIKLQPGKYDVYVALQIGNIDLMQLPGYRALRRDVERNPSRSNLAEFFVADRASKIRVDDSEESQAVIVRKYNCKIKKQKWTPVIAMFLPKADLKDTLNYIPKTERFGFDEEAVGIELDYWNVDSDDLEHLKAILKRIGAVVYKCEDPKELMFFGINPEDGEIYSLPVKPPSTR